MQAGQAIGNNIMELMMSVKASSFTAQTSESSTAKVKDSVSFNLILEKQTQVKMTSQDSGVTTSAGNKGLSSKCKNDVDDAVQTSKPQSQDNVTTQKSSDEKISQTTESKKTNGSDSKKVAEVVEQVKEIVQDTLDVTEEQLMLLLENLGCTLMDLLNPDTLKQLILQQNGGSDEMLLLTDEFLHQTLTKLLGQVEEALKNASITKETVTDMQDNHEFMSKVMELVNRKADEKVEAKTKEIKANEPMKIVDGNDITTDSKISFHVEKNSENNHQTSSESQNQSDNHTSNRQAQASVTQPTADDFINQMTNTVATTQTEFESALQSTKELQQIAHQVIEQIKLVIKPTQTSMEFTLNPEHLGKVALHISSKEGVLTASFATQTQAAKEAIESQLQVLKENLNNQGIKVEAIEVSIMEHSFGESNQMQQESQKQQTFNRQKSKTIKMGFDETDTFEEAIESEEKFMQDGVTFDYSA